MKTSTKSLFKGLVLVACTLAAAVPAAEANSGYSKSSLSANHLNSKSTFLPASRYGLLAPSSVNTLPAIENSSMRKYGDYALPSGGLPYSSTNAISIDVCDDEQTGSSPEFHSRLDGDDAPVVYDAPRHAGGVR